MNIAVSLNHRYVSYTYVMLTSLFINHVGEKVTVWVLHSDLSDEDLQLFSRLGERYGQEIRPLTLAQNEQLSKLPTTSNWPLETYYRLLLGELLPESVERILYLDVDIIVNKPLTELYHVDLKGMELAAVDDAIVQSNYGENQKKLFSDIKNLRYFNAGVVLYDMEKVRKKYRFTDYYKVAEKFSFQLTNLDQDLLNYVHAGNVLYVDKTRYNVFSQMLETMENGGYDRAKQDVAIIHYAGRKPWNYNGVHYEVERLWWEYAKETPFYYEMMEPVFLGGLSNDSYGTFMQLLQENQELKKNLGESMALCQKLFGMLPK